MAATRYAEFNVNNGDILFRCGGAGKVEHQ